MTAYVPNTGDIVWVDFSPHAGQETAARHPAVVLSVAFYSVATGLALVVPITSKIKGGTFEVPLKGTDLVRGKRPITGAALANEIRTIDIEARNVERADTCPTDILERIKAIATALIEGEIAVKLTPQRFKAVRGGAVIRIVSQRPTIAARLTYESPLGIRPAAIKVFQEHGPAHFEQPSDRR